MREIPVACENGVSYAILVEEIYFEGELLGESYGVCLRKGEEQEQILRLTVNEGRIRELLALLLRCGVTPVSLWDVVEDWL